MVANYHHNINSDYAEVIVVDDLSQAADLVIVNLCKENDIVVTQDYGLAALVIAKKALSIHPQGKIYDNECMEGLLMQRFISQKARQAGYRTKGPSRRSNNDDKKFISNMNKLINRYNKSRD